MVHAFSQLKRVLGERKLSVPQLQRRLEERGLIVNLKSLYRLAKDDQPLERLNLRVAGMICQVCDVPLSELIAFDWRANAGRWPRFKARRTVDAIIESAKCPPPMRRSEAESR
jgi:hypothetical protein